MINGIDGENILKRVAQGDAQAYEKLVRYYTARVYAYCLKSAKDSYAAEELTQEVFIKLWEHRATLSQVHTLEAYLFTIAKNRSFRFLQKAARDQQRQQELWQHYRAQAAASEAEDPSEAVHQLAQQAIRQLPRRRQQVFTMSRVDGLTHAEIAQELGISKHTVKEHMIQALKTLRKYLRPRIDAIVWLLVTSIRFW